jgi:hypothetical protein
MHFFVPVVGSTAVSGVVALSHLNPAGQVSQAKEPAAAYLPMPQTATALEPLTQKFPAVQVVQVVAAALGPGPSVF